MRTHARHWLPSAAICVCAFLFAALAAILTPLPVCTIGARDDLGCARGFQTREGERRPFRWSDDHAWVALPGMGWGGPQAISVTLAAPRTAGLAQPVVTLAAAGIAANFMAPAVPRRYTLLVPSPNIGADTLNLSIRSETFAPPGDGRDLGSAIYEVRGLPTNAPRLPGLLPLLLFAIIAVALSRLLARVWHPDQSALADRPFGAALAGLLMVGMLSVLSVAMPMRVSPFLPGLAIILMLAASLLPRLGLSRIPATLWGAACAGAALDALLVTNLVRGEWTALILIAQALLLLWGVVLAGKQAIQPGTLLALALIVRLLGFATRLLSGYAAVDPDTELFYNYGRATIELGVPLVEYPSGAPLIWALLALPASRELFALLLPLLNLASDLAIVWGIATIGRLRHQPAEQVLVASLACGYALASLLLPFWHGKYDSLPAALTIVGLALFAHQRFGASGAALGLGGAIKWAPWLAIPILAWQLIATAIGQQRSSQPIRGAARRSFVIFMGGLVLAILAVSLPFALRDWQAFLTPYTVQGARPLIGESFWFLPALLFEPQLLQTLAAPWSGSESRIITPTLTLLVQLLALLALGLAAMLRPIEPRRILALAALATATFLLLNRVYSPQYALPIAASLLIAGAAVLQTRRDVLVLTAALAVMQAANLMVWPYTRSFWLIPSAIQFAAGLGAAIWLAIRAIHRPPSPELH